MALAQDIYKAAIETPAEAIRKVDETIESAVSRYLESPAGRAASERYRATRATNGQTLSGAEQAVVKAEGPTTTTLLAKAEALRTADHSLTHEQALARAYELNPALMAAARAEGRHPVAPLPAA